MKYFQYIIYLIAIWLVLPFSLSAWDILQTSNASQFIRFVPAKNIGVTSFNKMQTAIIQYQKNNIQIDLVAAVHIADKKYYQNLNQIFKQYDAVLFELVGTKDSLPQNKFKQLTNRSRIGQLQNKLASMLDLQMQLQWINYHASNFVHADMDWHTYQYYTKKHKENIWEMIWQESWDQSMASQKKIDSKYALGWSDIFGYLFYKKYADRLKTKLAYHFAHNFNASFLTNKPTVIITRRNDKAMNILAQELKKNKKKIAIFYGAIHMPDFEKRLIQVYGFKKTNTIWVTAWEMLPQ